MEVGLFQEILKNWSSELKGKGSESNSNVKSTNQLNCLIQAQGPKRQDDGKKRQKTSTKGTMDPEGAPLLTYSNICQR